MSNDNKVQHLRNVPKLRFKEFRDEWEKEYLKNLVIFLDNKRKPLSSIDRQKRQGNYPYYGASGIIDYIDDYIFDIDTILLGEDGANIIDRSSRLAFIASGQYWVNNHAHVLRVNDENDIYFISESLENIKYDKYNTGTAQPKLNAEVCKKIILRVPSKIEQTKIAHFIRSIDRKIDLLEAKLENLKLFKKGLAKQLLQHEKYETKRLSDIAQLTMGQSPDSKSYNNSNIGLPLIQGNADIFNRKTQPRNYTSEPTKTCEAGDIIMTVRAPVGYIGKSKHKACIGRGVCSIKANQCTEFLYQLLLVQEDKWAKLSQGSTFEAVNSKDIKSLKVKVPSIEEQEKIATTLLYFDYKINSIDKKSQTLKQFKKGLLQQMFV